MTELSTDELSFLSDLFVRAGIFVSHCDDTDIGEESENLETKQLGRALARVSANARYPLVATLADMALKKISHPFTDTQDSIVADLEQAAQFLFRLENPEQLLEYRRAVMYAATSVARAYREELDHHEEEFLLENILSRITGFLNKAADHQEFKNINISPAEDSALTAISEALKL